MLVLGEGVKSCADIGPVNDLLSVVSKNHEGHGMAHMFTDANTASTALLGVRRETGVI